MCLSAFTATVRPPQAAQHSHCAVGKQQTVNGPGSSTARVSRILDLANNPNTLSGSFVEQLALAVNGLYEGEPRGFVYSGNNQHQSDSDPQTVSHNELLSAAQADNNEPLTWTLVHNQIANRLGIDRDIDGIVNSDDQPDTDGDGTPRHCLPIRSVMPDRHLSIPSLCLRRCIGATKATRCLQFDHLLHVYCTRAILLRPPLRLYH